MSPTVRRPSLCGIFGTQLLETNIEIKSPLLFKQGFECQISLVGSSSIIGEPSFIDEGLIRLVWLQRIVSKIMKRLVLSTYFFISISLQESRNDESG